MNTREKIVAALRGGEPVRFALGFAAAYALFQLLAILA